MRFLTSPPRKTPLSPRGLQFHPLYRRRATTGDSQVLQSPPGFRYACTLTEYFKKVQERQESEAKEVEAMGEEGDTE